MASEQTIKTPMDAPMNKLMRIGSRGGLYYQDKGNSTTVKPDYKCEGPGFSILFFKTDSPSKLRVLYNTKSPYSKKKLDEIEKKYQETHNIQEAIRLCTFD